MASEESGSEAGAGPEGPRAPGPRAPGPRVAPGEAARAAHPRGFKLRFAAPREPGRSDVSLVKPLGLPATVAGKFYARAGAVDAADRAAEEAALRRVQRMFAEGPRDKYQHPVLTSHECGWWARAARREAAVLRHHLRDSAWMRERLRVLAADTPTKHR